MRKIQNMNLMERISIKKNFKKEVCEKEESNKEAVDEEERL